MSARSHTMARPAAAPAPVHRAADSLRGGAPLPGSLRAEFEPALGADLSHIRLHTDARAGAAAEGIGARAFALGHHIAFAPGAFAPGSAAGRHLIAHELVHTLQKGRSDVIRRTCPKGEIKDTDTEKFNAAEDRIKAMPAYQDLPKRAAKADADWFEKHAPATAAHIIDGARASECALYYLDRLEALFNTPDPVEGTGSGSSGEGKPRAMIAAEHRKAMVDALLAEQGRLLVQGELDRYFEEERAMLPSAGRVFQKVWNPKFAKFFHVDARDPTDIYVILKVRLVKADGGRLHDLELIRHQEDAIEKHAKQEGYTLDLRFVKTEGEDVFEIPVDPSQWPHSNNWIEGPSTLAHEAHHLLNLADRYDYIENHHNNDAIDIPRRLNLFERQMVRAPDPLAGRSGMEDSAANRAINEQDICAVAYGAEAGETAYRACLVARFAMRDAKALREIAHDLADPYDPRNAPLLAALRDAWWKRPRAERIASLPPGKAASAAPPEEDFGEFWKVVEDDDAHEIPRPHRPPSPDRMKTKTRGQP